MSQHINREFLAKLEKTYLGTVDKRFKCPMSKFLLVKKEVGIFGGDGCRIGFVPCNPPKEIFEGTLEDYVFLCQDMAYYKPRGTSIDRYRGSNHDYLLICGSGWKRVSTEQIESKSYSQSNLMSEEQAKQKLTILDKIEELNKNVKWISINSGVVMKTFLRKNLYGKEVTTRRQKISLGVESYPKFRRLRVVELSISEDGTIELDPCNNGSSIVFNNKETPPKYKHGLAGMINIMDFPTRPVFITPTHMTVYTNHEVLGININELKEEVKFEDEKLEQAFLEYTGLDDPEELEKRDVKPFVFVFYNENTKEYLGIKPIVSTI